MTKELKADSELRFKKFAVGKYKLVEMQGDFYPPLCPENKNDKKFLECKPIESGKSAKMFKCGISAGNVNAVTGQEYYHRISGLKNAIGKSKADDGSPYFKGDNALLVNIENEESITIYVFNHKRNALNSLFKDWAGGAKITVKD